MFWGPISSSQTEKVLGFVIVQLVYGRWGGEDEGEEDKSMSMVGVVGETGRSLSSESLEMLVERF